MQAVAPVGAWAVAAGLEARARIGDLDPHAAGGEPGVDRHGVGVGPRAAVAHGIRDELGGMRLRDDVALLAIRCAGQPSLLALSIAGGPAAPGEARRALTQALAGRVPAETQGDALIVVLSLIHI